MKTPPTLIFDKSVLHILGSNECLELSDQYFFVTTPILVMEIANNLLKYEEDDEQSTITKSLISKLNAHSRMGAFLTHSHLKLLYTELSTGRRVPMEGKAVRPDMQLISSPELGKGLYLDLSKESATFRRWKHAGLNDFDTALSQYCINSLDFQEDD